MRLQLEGLGDSCPSVEQWQGIADINDPCQSAGTVTTPSGSTQALNSIAPLTSSQYNALPGISSSTQTLLLAGGAALLLFMARGRGR